MSEDTATDGAGDYVPAPRVFGGMPLISAEGLAKLFHETYERLAPEFGYKTRDVSAVPWDQVPRDNRQLMTATAAAVLGELHSTLEWLVAQARADGAAEERERIAAALIAVDPVEWALAGRHAGSDAAQIARRGGPS